MSLPAWSPERLARTDDDYDYDRASDGISRFGQYLRQHQDLIRGFEDEPVTAAAFAVGAWDIATRLMDPRYVHLRPDLHGITLSRSEDGGDDLVVTVHVPLGHSYLPRRLPAAWHDWDRDTYALTSHPAYWGRVTPHDARPAVLITAQVRLPMSGRLLHTPTHVRGTGLTLDAKTAVAAVVQHVNAHATQVTTVLHDEYRVPLAAGRSH